MNFKPFLYKLLLNLLIVFSVLQSSSGSVELPTDIAKKLVLLFVLAVGIMLYEPILRFLTIKINFLTQLLITTVVVAGILYGADVIYPAFHVNTSAISSQSFQFITIDTIPLSKEGTIIFVSVIIALLSALFTKLGGSSKE